MKLFIAEKPSLARAIADVLPKPHKKQEGFIEVGDGDIVTWCIGHLLEQAPPEDYDVRYKKWLDADLPIIPTQWQLKPKTKTKKQLSVIKKLIKRATVIVNAGDADREGQILVDEVINYCGASKTKIAQAQRCLISDLNAAAVSKSIRNLKPNKEFVPLAVSALARARADWLYGLNMTRLCTLQGQKSGYSGVLSIGRVQTPILGLVVNRDISIEQFVSKPFFEVMAHIETQGGVPYQGKWQPSEACEPYMDEDGRVLSKGLAQNVVRRISQKHGEVIQVKSDNKRQSVPLPFSLSGLQIAAAKAFGMSAKVVLDTCQQLYERHKLITYPRSDCQYLPTEHLNDAAKVVAAINQVSTTLKSRTAEANLTLKSRAWNDKKVSAHHAIIPTAKRSGSLNDYEQKLYDMIARQYLAQFYPVHEYQEKRIETVVEGGVFVSKQNVVSKIGWKALFQFDRSESSNLKSQPQNSYDTEQADKVWPDVRVGDEVFCQQGELIEKQTSPPKHFTDATLLSALTGIARFVDDKTIKQQLRDSDGLGTEATRAGIIELLFTRGFLRRKGKDILATEVGRQLIVALPETISAPDMTALWESQLNGIYQQSVSYQQFISGIEQNLYQLIDQVRQVQFVNLPNQPKRQFTGKKKSYKRKSKKPSVIKKSA